MPAASLADALAQGARAPLELYADTQRKAARHVLRMTHRLTSIATIKSGTGSRVRDAIIASAAHLPRLRRKFARTLAGVR